MVARPLDGQKAVSIAIRRRASDNCGNRYRCRNARFNVVMPDMCQTAVAAERLNVADRLAEVAAKMPSAIAVACPGGRSPRYRTDHKGDSRTAYSMVTFAELDADATRIARGLAAWGVPPGTRLALMVRPGIEFVTLVFALLRAGMVIVLIDPGIGRGRLMRCLADVEPEGLVAIAQAQLVRLLFRRKFPRAYWNVTVGRRWLWGGLTLDQLRGRGDQAVSTMATSLSTAESMLPATRPADPAAIIFTSGSTGPPKGVLYTHRMFDTQVSEIQRTYGIEQGGVDLACFPLFALFNSAMGVTTVLPKMNFSRPASADPSMLLAAANDWQVTQAFASPSVWRVLSDHCHRTGARIASLRQVFSCGAPVPADVLRATLACIADDAEMHTPYGATECLPVATIEADEVLSQTAVRTDEGAGVCVGHKFDTIDWRIIRITDEPVATIDDAEVLPDREIGELIVRGPQASPCYVTRPEANAEAKITDAHGLWHRMGDVGYRDDRGRFWYCGRMAHRVETGHQPLFTECVEAFSNRHPAVRRSALVGLGPRGRQTPVLVVERFRNDGGDDVRRDLLALLQSHGTQVKHVLTHPCLPVDARHNAKIEREQLAGWAARQLPELS